jgi:hypothetical protein
MAVPDRGRRSNAACLLLAQSEHHGREAMPAFKGKAGIGACHWKIWFSPKADIGDAQPWGEQSGNL